MLKIIITGPESSGKTTLCKALANHFTIPFSKEYAREYLEKIDKFEVLQVPLSKSTPKSKMDEYVKQH